MARRANKPTRAQRLKKQRRQAAADPQKQGGADPAAKQLAAAGAGTGEHEGNVPAEAGGAAQAKKPKVGPFQFIQQVRQEVSKVTWPTRNETVVTTIMVFIMVVLAGIFFFLVDLVLRQVMQLILRLAS
ncbi:MAG: preprotein translocase subunit SecE [Pseudomonadota bacterium]